MSLAESLKTALDEMTVRATAKTLHPVRGRQTTLIFDGINEVISAGQFGEPIDDPNLLATALPWINDEAKWKELLTDTPDNITFSAMTRWDDAIYSPAPSIPKGGRSREDWRLAGGVRAPWEDDSDPINIGWSYPSIAVVVKRLKVDVKDEFADNLTTIIAKTRGDVSIARPMAKALKTAMRRDKQFEGAIDLYLTTQFNLWLDKNIELLANDTEKQILEDWTVEPDDDTSRKVWDGLPPFPPY